MSQVHLSQVFYIFYQSIIFQLSHNLCKYICQLSHFNPNLNPELLYICDFYICQLSQVHLFQVFYIFYQSIIFQLSHNLCKIYVNCLKGVFAYRKYLHLSFILFLALILRPSAQHRCYIIWLTAALTR